MKNQPVLYDSLKSILHHMDANLRIKMSQRMPSIRATEKAVPLKMKYLSIKDTTVEINDVCYQLGIYRDYPNGDIPQFVKRENALGGMVNDFDRFGFEIPIGLNPILPGDVSVRNENEPVVPTDTDELEERFYFDLSRWRNILHAYANKEWEDHAGYSRKKDLQDRVDRVREKFKPFHCRRHNLPPPFNCYIQLSAVKDGNAQPLQRLVYNRKLYEAVKQFNHTLFANRPVIRVNKLVCLGSHVYRIPVGMKISANELTVRESQIASIVTMIDGDVDTLQVSAWENAKNWWQHRLVKNANQLITDDSPSAEQSTLMFITLGNRVIRFHNLGYVTTEQYFELIGNWMSVKREVGTELWIDFRFENLKNEVLEKMQTRMEVVRRDERCVTILSGNGTRVEVFEELCADEIITYRWAVKVKMIKN
ncbi:unnamed protein product [Caenorhabditis nigoni]